VARVRASLFKCCFVDCAGCYVFLLYVGVVCCYFVFREHCQQSMPNLMRWLLVELIFRVCETGFYCCVQLVVLVRIIGEERVKKKRIAEKKIKVIRQVESI